MQGLPFVLLFTALTFLSWGAYGPLLRYGTTAMGHDGLKAFVGVGLAYFVIAVIVPFWILQKKGEKGKWTLLGHHLLHRRRFRRGHRSPRNHPGTRL